MADISEDCVLEVVLVEVSEGEGCEEIDHEFTSNVLHGDHGWLENLIAGKYVVVGRHKLNNNVNGVNCHDRDV